MTEVAPSSSGKISQLESPENGTSKKRTRTIFKYRFFVLAAVAICSLVVFGLFVTNTAFVTNNDTNDQFSVVVRRIDELENSFITLTKELDGFKVEIAKAIEKTDKYRNETTDTLVIYAEQLESINNWQNETRDEYDEFFSQIKQEHADYDKHISTIVHHLAMNDENIIELYNETENLLNVTAHLDQNIKQEHADYDKHISTIDNHLAMNDENIIKLYNETENLLNVTAYLELEINTTQIYLHQKLAVGRRELDIIEDEMKTVLFNASCYEYWIHDETTDANYFIQPSLDGPPFEVFCQFDDKGAITIVKQHQMENGFTATPNENDGCDERGCYVDKVTYNATKFQLEALMHISESCEQDITHNCTVNALTNYAFWNDRYGREIKYWNGDKPTTATGCKCYETNSCDKLQEYDNERQCNCDDMRDGLIDHGTITSMSQLPITQLNYGGSARPLSWIEYDLGPFKCSGRKNLLPAEIKSTDFSFMVATTGADAVVKENMPISFNDTVFDNAYSSISPNGTFIAPIRGFYRFELQLSVTGLMGFVHVIDVLIQGQQVTSLIENGGAILTEDPYPKTIRHVIEARMDIGDGLVLFASDVLSIAYFNAGTCVTAGKSHQCTYLTGRLMKRYEDEFG